MSRIAVLGLGSAGITAVKNLREQGFEAVGFERNDYVGGLWQYTPDENVTSVLKSTRTNISRLRFTYSDFEYPPELKDNYPLASDVAKYIQAYAAHFDILKHCRLGFTVRNLEREKGGQGWNLTVAGKDGKTLSEQYDRIVVCTGPQTRALLPDHEGATQFKGLIMRAQAFKEPEKFAGKRVVVVGLSNTAGDVIADLVAAGSEVFASHRSGVRIVSRTPEGKQPTDHKISRRIFTLSLRFLNTFPRVAGRASELGVEYAMKSAFGSKMRKEWRLLPAPPIPNTPPLVNDYMVDYLISDTVKSVHGIRRYLPDGTSIEMLDGEILTAIDAVIYCTGYTYDFSYLGKDADPTSHPTPEWDALPHAKGTPYPRLFWGIWSEKYPESLAFIGPYRGHSFSAFANADLTSAAIANIWKGNHPTPTREEMREWCDANYHTAVKAVGKWRLQSIACKPLELQRFLNDAAGNGVNESLGWGWTGWKFWLRDPRLYYLIMDGVDTSFIQRVFDGKAERGRKKWDGARDAILRANGKL
ncbi:hypothetical protein Dda_0223 [Drechslerella dactyloides]|uniref:Uncharacterized protein n=1 Tax=Drechslerella dactyloides TaxID=74499 RepID=A0AAD6NMW5_DREDA|nr:hypothetical protein Dda_0223 [Drechslerella dactyloides]